MDLFHREAPPNLASIKQSWKDCKKCYFWQNRTQVIPYNGPDRPTILVVGQAPGEKEDAENQLFLGKSGSDTRKGLRQIVGIPEEDVGFANVLACFTRTFRSQFLSNCHSLLDQIIDATRPKLIVAMGGVAAKRLGFSGRMEKTHGTLTVYRSIPVVCSYHPAKYYREEDDAERKRVGELIRKDFTAIHNLLSQLNNKTSWRKED